MQYQDHFGKPLVPGDLVIVLPARNVNHRSIGIQATFKGWAPVCLSRPPGYFCTRPDEAHVAIQAPGDEPHYRCGSTVALMKITPDERQFEEESECSSSELTKI